MITYLNMPFFKRDDAWEEIYMTGIKAYLLTDEKIEQKLPMFVSGDVAMFFTDKRMVFVRRPQNLNGFEKILEMEFLPYRSIKKFSFLKSNFEKDYCIYISVAEESDFSFALDDLGVVTRILEIIGRKCL